MQGWNLSNSDNLEDLQTFHALAQLHDEELRREFLDVSKKVLERNASAMNSKKLGHVSNFGAHVDSEIIFERLNKIAGRDSCP